MYIIWKEATYSGHTRHSLFSLYHRNLQAKCHFVWHIRELLPWSCVQLRNFLFFFFARGGTWIDLFPNLYSELRLTHATCQRNIRRQMIDSWSLCTWRIPREWGVNSSHARPQDDGLALANKTVSCKGEQMTDAVFFLFILYFFLNPMPFFLKNVNQNWLVCWMKSDFQASLCKAQPDLP